MEGRGEKAGLRPFQAGTGGEESGDPVPDPYTAVLVTGRTHQIRAQFAAAGHPLIGDGKYGSERENRKYGRHGQALYSYKLEFCFTTEAGALEELNGRCWQVEAVDFVEEYF